MKLSTFLTAAGFVVCGCRTVENGIQSEARGRSTEKEVPSVAERTPPTGRELKAEGDNGQENEVPTIGPGPLLTLLLLRLTPTKSHNPSHLPRPQTSQTPSAAETPRLRGQACRTLGRGC